MPVQYLVLGGAVRTNFLVGETDGQTDRTKTIRVYVSLRIKWKTKNTILLGTVPESNRKIVEIGTLYTPNTEIRRPLTFLAWYNHFYQCGGVKLVYGRMRRESSYLILNMKPLSSTLEASTIVSITTPIISVYSWTLNFFNQNFYKIIFPIIFL